MAEEREMTEFFEVFGFKPKRGDCVLLEDAIVRTILTDFADKFRNVNEEIENIKKKYTGAAVEDLEEARDDLNRVRGLSEEKYSTHQKWIGAKQLAEVVLSMKLEGTIETFQSSVM